MKIAVLDFNCSSVDIITVDEAFIDTKYNGEIEDFLTDHCQYNLDMIQWMGPIAELNLDMTEQSFEAEDFVWTPTEQHIQHFKTRKSDCSQILEILLVDDRIFGDDNENLVVMDFYDGYAIERRYDNHPRLILLYPTIDETKQWNCVEEKVLSYTSCKTEEDITPYDIALAHGVLYWETEL